MANLSEETSLDEEEQFSVCQQKNSQHEKKTPAESPFSPILFAYSEDFALPELPLRAPLYSDLSNSWDSSAASQLEFPSAVHNSEGDDSSPPSSPLLDANQGESKASSYTKPVPVRYDHSEDDSEEIDIESVTATATKRGRLKQPQRTKGGQKARSRRKKASDDEYEDAPLSTTARKNRRSSSRRNKNAPTHNRRKEDDDTGVAEEEQEPCEAYNDYLAKKKLLHTITHVLPRDKLAGIIDIVNPSYSDADGNSDVLEFDINSLDKLTLLRLHEYVLACVEEESNRIKEEKRKQLKRRKQQMKRNNKTNSDEDDDGDEYNPSLHTKHTNHKTSLRSNITKKTRTKQQKASPTSRKNTPSHQSPSKKQPIRTDVIYYKGRNVFHDHNLLLSKGVVDFQEVFEEEEVVRVDKCEEDDIEVDILGLDDEEECESEGRGFDIVDVEVELRVRHHDRSAGERQQHQEAEEEEEEAEGCVFVHSANFSRMALVS
ncbi:hypothetical protein QOT17_012712 [Balamuthia mandrillaris]